MEKKIIETYFNRQDCYAIQQANGAYFYIKKPVTEKLIKSHLLGRITLGTYLLSQKNTAKYCVLDLDDDESKQKMLNNLDKISLPSYFEHSRRGGHLWFYFEEPIEGKFARSFGREMARRLDLDCEVFPKQDIAQGPGSLIRLPFGIHRKSGRSYLYEGFSTWRESLLNLASPVRRVSLKDVLNNRYQEPKKEVSLNDLPKKREITTSDKALWQKIKESVSVEDFVSQYVNLNGRGIGKCPFHEDTLPSFSINKEKNYWYCFAGCGSGSVIDFYMKLKNLDFSSAVKELGEKLGLT